MKAIMLRDCPVVAKNDSAALLDLRDGIACLEFRTKGNAITDGVAQLMTETMQIYMKDFRGLVVGNQAKNFSVGADLNVMRDEILVKNFEPFYGKVREFEEFNQSIKDYHKPIVCAMQRRALGGGLEMALHCHRRVAAQDLMAGLVELGVGLIPGGGGVKESLVHASASANPEAGVRIVLENLIFAKTSANAKEAQEMLFLDKQDIIVQNTEELISTAKAVCLELCTQERPEPKEAKVLFLGREYYKKLDALLDQYAADGLLTPYSLEVAKYLAQALTGADRYSEAQSAPETAVWEYERRGTSRFIQNPKTLERIEHVLSTGKLLRN